MTRIHALHSTALQSCTSKYQFKGPTVRRTLPVEGDGGDERRDSWETLLFLSASPPRNFLWNCPALARPGTSQEEDSNKLSRGPSYSTREKARGRRIPPNFPLALIIDYLMESFCIRVRMDYWQRRASKGRLELPFTARLRQHKLVSKEGEALGTLLRCTGGHVGHVAVFFTFFFGGAFWAFFFFFFTMLCASLGEHTHEFHSFIQKKKFY